MKLTAFGYALVIILLANLIGGQYTMAQDTKKKEGEEQQKFTVDDANRYFAVSLNNLVWELLAKEDRTLDENERMVNAAHASFYHWSVVGKPVNLARGYWLISHVYAVLKQGGQALYFANRCMEITQKAGLVDFDLAYAYEGLARAYAASGDKIHCQENLQEAQAAGEKIKNQEDKDLFFNDFKADPWFGLR
jgi:hypothetical protein